MAYDIGWDLQAERELGRMEARDPQLAKKVFEEVTRELSSSPSAVSKRRRRIVHVIRGLGVAWRLACECGPSVVYAVSEAERRVEILGIVEHGKR